LCYFLFPCFSFFALVSAKNENKKEKRYPSAEGYRRDRVTCVIDIYLRGGTCFPAGTSSFKCWWFVAPPRQAELQTTKESTAANIQSRATALYCWTGVTVVSERRSTSESSPSWSITQPWKR